MCVYECGGVFIPVVVLEHGGVNRETTHSEGVVFHHRLVEFRNKYQVSDMK